MGYGGVDRRQGDSMEVMLGEVRGQLMGIRESIERVERRLDDYNRSENDLLERINDLAMSHETLKTEAKIGWKILTGIAAAASVGGAGVKHFLEKII